MLEFINLVCKYFNHAKVDSKDIFDDLIDAECCRTENVLLLALALGGNEVCSSYFTFHKLLINHGRRIL